MGQIMILVLFYTGGNISHTILNFYKKNEIYFIKSFVIPLGSLWLNYNRPHFFHLILWIRGVLYELKP